MSKRLLTLFTLVLVMIMLAPSAMVFAQDEPILVLSEEQINADFTLPSTAARQISNLEVDVQEDGVYMTFDMTTVRDGTSNTVGIIAVLIGLAQPRVNQMSFYDLLISSYVTPSRTARREVANLLTGAWSDYVRGVVQQNSLNFTKITYNLMEEDGILFFGSEAEASDGPDVQWCLECSRP